MLKRPLSILILSALPALALASGNDADGHAMPAHGMPGHDMSTMSNASSPIGQPGDPAKVTRTIEGTMDDSMRFTPSKRSEESRGGKEGVSTGRYRGSPFN